MGDGGNDWGINRRVALSPGEMRVGRERTFIIHGAGGAGRRHGAHRRTEDELVATER